MSASNAGTQSGSPIARVEAALEAAGCGPIRRGTARCPAHEDRNPSLGISEGADGRVLLVCRAGCPIDKILAELGLVMTDLFPPRSKRANGKAGASRHRVAEYVYTDRVGEPLARKVRFDPKDFIWEVPDGRGDWRVAGRGEGNPRVLYNLPLVVEAEEVWISEGEKGADALSPVLPPGSVATTIPVRTKALEAWATEPLRGRAITIVEDRDRSGREQALAAYRALVGVAASVRIVRSATEGESDDAFDHLAAGFGIDGFVDVEAPPPADGNAAETPRFSRLEEQGYRLALPDLSTTIEVTHLRRERYQLRGEVLVRSTLVGTATVADGVLSVGDVNLSSARSRQEYARHLAERARTEAEPWESAVEELALRVLAAERAGEPDVSLPDVTVEPTQIVEIEGLRLPRHHPTVTFGDGDSMKSYLALYILGRLARDGLAVGLADWELSESDHRERLGRLFPDAMPPVRYLRCARPIVHEADRLRRWVRERRLDFVVFDSVAYASAGAPESAEVAMAYFQTLRQLGSIGSLHIAHITKAAEGADRRPFGSAFWHNSPRATWFVKLAERDPGGTVSRLGLYPRKWNVGPLPPSVGFEFTFTADRTIVRGSDPSDTPDLAVGLSIRLRMIAALRRGAMTTVELAEETEAQAATVRRTARRYSDAFRVEGDVISLCERRRE